MNNSVEELNLGESYDFDVIAKFGGTSVTGKLHLSSSKCSLILSGDTTEDRQVDVSWNDLDHLLCTSLNKHFLLIGLTLTSAASRTVEHFPQPIGGFELHYEVQSVVFSRLPIAADDLFSSLELQGPAIRKWVGQTSTQYDIVRAYEAGSPFRDMAKHEVKQAVEDVGSLSVDYVVETHYSEDFEAGVRFPPRIALFFYEEIRIAQVIEILEQLKSLLAVAIGVPILCTSVKLGSNHNSFYRCSLYSKQPPAKKLREWPMYPLGHNLQHDQLGLPAFPEECFNAFFKAGNNIKNAFSKYVKYRAFANPEEKFLGYFRLLEKLTTSKESYVDADKLAQLLKRGEKYLSKYFGKRKPVVDLSKQVIRANNSKLNTAGCIRRFMKLIPAEVRREWIYGNAEIDQICKMRNDLTHANEIEPSDVVLQKYAKFIEVLLVLALFNEIGVSPEGLTLVIQRLEGYHWITKPVEPKIIKYS